MDPVSLYFSVAPVRLVSMAVVLMYKFLFVVLSVSVIETILSRFFLLFLGVLVGCALADRAVLIVAFPGPGCSKHR